MEYENWRVLADYPDYAVSDLGRVKRVVPDAFNRPMRVLRQTANMGYPAVSLHVDKRQKTRRVHLLVAAAFLGPTPPGYEVRHLDGKKLNPRLANLEFGTRADNEADKVRHGRSNRGSRHGLSKLTESQVVRLRTDPRSIGEIKAAAGVTDRTIYSVRTRKTWTHV